MMTTDPVDLSARLIRCPSVTPEEGGALQLLSGVLSEAGFDCVRVDRNGVPRTMFKPDDGPTYWAQQKERAPTFGQRRSNPAE